MAVKYGVINEGSVYSLVLQSAAIRRRSGRKFVEDKFPILPTQMSPLKAIH
jgi:hypothetical protein